MAQLAKHQAFYQQTLCPCCKIICSYYNENAFLALFEISCWTDEFTLNRTRIAQICLYSALLLALCVNFGLRRKALDGRNARVRACFWHFADEWSTDAAWRINFFSAAYTSTSARRQGGARRRFGIRRAACRVARRPAHAPRGEPALAASPYGAVRRCRALSTTPRRV